MMLKTLALALAFGFAGTSGAAAQPTTPATPSATPPGAPAASANAAAVNANATVPAPARTTRPPAAAGRCAPGTPGASKARNLGPYDGPQSGSDEDCTGFAPVIPPPAPGGG